MDSRTGSVSSGRGSRSGRRGETLKSSPFCPRSSSKLTQSIIKDHMVSHYKMIYSAKAAIDASVPKSLTHSVKYKDRIRQEQLWKGGRPQSAQSVSQRSSRASCSSAQSQLSVQYDDSPYLCSRSSMISSPRFNTSFNAREMVYSSCKVGSRCQPRPPRPASEIKYRSPEATLHWRQSTCSLAALGDHSCYTSFQDPVQKTYSGDLLQKHSQHFTREKPFTPKTLKSEASSYLSKYRYYRGPQKMHTQDCIQSTMPQHETCNESTNTKDCTEELNEPSQGFNTEHECSRDRLNGTYLTSSRHQSGGNKSRSLDFLESSSRVFPEGWKSPHMKGVSAEEEELIYLEFISSVTEDILSRGHISDRVLDRVMKCHIDMNRHRLDEGKMLHLLEVLRKDLVEPVNVSNLSTELEKKENGFLDAFLPHLELTGEHVTAKENSDLFSYASLIQNCDFPEYDKPLLVSTPVHSPERPASSVETHEQDKKEINLEKGISTPGHSENASDNTGHSEEDSHQNQIGTTGTNEEVSSESPECITAASDQAQAEVSCDGQSKEFEDLGRSFSESLHINPQDNEATEQQANTAAAVSDDEF